MEEEDSSSSGVESSPSEGEYVLPENCCATSSPPPQFDFTGWSPEASSGLSFISIVPISCHGYEIAGQQREHVGKIKPSTSRKRTRRRSFHQGITIGRDIRDEKRLRQAVSDDDSNTAQWLLETGVDPNTCDDKKRTPLHFAAAKGNAPLVNLLLDKGADPNLKDTIGNTPLHLAACTCQVKVVTLLLKAGTDIHSVDKSGRSPLHIARSRLNLLHENKSMPSTQMKQEVSQVVDMMKEYLNLRGEGDDADQLSALCERLQRTSTREEVDEISTLLQDFTNLSLQKKETKPD